MKERHKMRRLVKTFKALSDMNRMRILKMLEVRPLCVCEMTYVLGLASSTVSKHLYLLRDAEFIMDQKQGKWVNYELSQENRQEYIGDLLPLLSKWLPDDQTVIADREKMKSADRNVLCGS